MKRGILSILLALAALPAAAQFQLPGGAPAVPYQLPGIKVPPFRFPGVNPGLPVRLPSVPLPIPVLNRPSISLPSPAVPVVAVRVAVSVPPMVLPAARALLSRNKADEGVSLEVLSKAFDNAGEAARPAVAVSAPSGSSSSKAPETQKGEPVKIKKVPAKPLTVPEWELEAEIGQP